MTSERSESMEQILARALEFENTHNWREAAKTYLSALAEAPLEARLWFRAGVCIRRAGAPSGAIQYLEKAGMLSPDTIEYHLELGGAYFELRAFDDAISSYLLARDIDPENVSVANNIGIALQEAGLNDDALSALERALTLSPNDPVVHSNLGAAYLKTGRVNDALKHLRTALDLDANQAEAWSNYGVALQEALRLDESLKAHDEAISRAPELHALHYNYSMALLLDGQFRAGFREFEHRKFMPDRKPREFDAPLWQGEKLTGQTILVHSEQGIGDALQFARFISLLKKYDAGRVCLAAHASTADLLGTLDGVDDVLTDIPGNLTFDYQVPLLSLPHLIDPELATLPDTSDGYLIVPTGARSALPEGSEKPRIGVVWAGNPKHANDHNRSCGLVEIAHVFDVPGIEWISLQVGEPAKEISRLDHNVLDLSEKLTDFTVTAATILELDLVITVDTSVVHLAGALGAPTWCLLAHAPDWRWMLSRDDTPWYSSVRLYRQQSAGDWTTLSHRIAEDLLQFLHRPQLTGR